MDFVVDDLIDARPRCSSNPHNRRRMYYQTSEVGAPALVIERLRQIYEAHAQAVTDYQLKALSGRGAPVQ